MSGMKVHKDGRVVNDGVFLGCVRPYHCRNRHGRIVKRWEAVPNSSRAGYAAIGGYRSRAGAIRELLSPIRHFGLGSDGIS